MNKMGCEAWHAGRFSHRSKTPMQRSDTMAGSQSDRRVPGFATKFFFHSVIATILCVGSGFCAQAQEAPPASADASWTATTQTSVENAAPTRTTESHSSSGNATTDRIRVEELGPNGRYVPNYETETETIQVDATTTRTVERSYKWDVNGQKNLVQVKEETNSSANGDAQAVRSTSHSDSEGNLRVVQREVADTKQTSPNTQETNSTVSLLDSNGALTPSLRTQGVETRGADNTVVAKTTTLAPDSSGAWKAAEIKESTVTQEGKNQTSEERVSTSDVNGKFSEVSRTVGHVTETAAGEQTTTVNTYSTELPGLPPDGSLHLNRRVTTVQKKDSSGITTEQQVEQPNADNPKAGLQVSRETKNATQYSVSGTEQTKTILVRDANGTLNLASVETRTSDQVSAEEKQAAPSSKSQ
jgi:hypothetical protein